MSNGGLNKLMEECGELIQVAAKLAAYPSGVHPDGKGDLKDRMVEEMGDVMAACVFVTAKFGLDKRAVGDRTVQKVQRFVEWDSV